eukprot:COSAG04_NODE_9222_length_885_cov_1.170483_2_plen_70_part_01
MQVYWEEAIAPIVEKRRKQQAMGKWDQRLKRAKAEQQVTTVPPAGLVAFLLWGCCLCLCLCSWFCLTLFL